MIDRLGRETEQVYSCSPGACTGHPIISVKTLIRVINSSHNQQRMWQYSDLYTTTNVFVTRFKRSSSTTRSKSTTISYKSKSK